MNLCQLYLTKIIFNYLLSDIKVILLAAYLGGRYVEFMIYPFSFEEYLDCKRQEQDFLPADKWG